MWFWTLVDALLCTHVRCCRHWRPCPERCWWSQTTSRPCCPWVSHTRMSWTLTMLCATSTSGCKSTQCIARSFQQSNQTGVKGLPMCRCCLARCANDERCACVALHQRPHAQLYCMHVSFMYRACTKKQKHPSMLLSSTGGVGKSSGRRSTQRTGSVAQPQPQLRRCSSRVSVCAVSAPR